MRNLTFQTNGVLVLVLVSVSTTLLLFIYFIFMFFEEVPNHLKCPIILRQTPNTAPTLNLFNFILNLNEFKKLVKYIRLQYVCTQKQPQWKVCMYSKELFQITGFCTLHKVSHFFLVKKKKH